MSGTPKPNTNPPICKQCNAEANWDSKWADWSCFLCHQEEEEEEE
jgi:hypothetical protein